MNTLTKGTQGAAYSQSPRHTVQQIIRFHLSVWPDGYTRRALSKTSGLEIATLCGGLAAMQKKGEVEVLSTTTCPVTGREVAVYTLKKGATNG